MKIPTEDFTDVTLSIGDNWNDNTGWLESSNHCDNWYDVRCSWNMVRYMDLDTNNLVGEFPADLGGIERFHTLKVAGNSMTGDIPAEICSNSIEGIISLEGDTENCPNDFEYETGMYMAGCCDNVDIDLDIYIQHFAVGILGDGDCENLEGVETDVCNFMTDKENHDLFANGYPEDFNGNVWQWMKVSHLYHLFSVIMNRAFTTS